MIYRKIQIFLFQFEIAGNITNRFHGIVALINIINRNIAPQALAIIDNPDAGFFALQFSYIPPMPYHRLGSTFLCIGSGGCANNFTTNNKVHACLAFETAPANQEVDVITLYLERLRRNHTLGILPAILGRIHKMIALVTGNSGITSFAGTESPAFDSPFRITPPSFKVIDQNIFIRPGQAGHDHYHESKCASH